jgi:hypothetical protein
MALIKENTTSFNLVNGTFVPFLEQYCVVAIIKTTHTQV